MITRREFGRAAMAGLTLPHLAGAGIDSRVAGVRLGAQSYSFRDLPSGAGRDVVGDLVKAFTAVGLGECELWSPHIEPGRGAEREALRRWRLETPLDHFRRIGRQFTAAGIVLYAYNYSVNESFTDEEIDRGFAMAKALGAEIIAGSATLAAAKRMAPFAEQHRMVVAMHNHSRIDPNEFATPDSFAAAMKMSRYFKVNLDIGHFTAANYDPVAYLREHHASVTHLHLKDRRKNQGDNTPWGRGDTPIGEVLQLLKKERWPIRAYVEYEYRGTGSPIEEVKTCYAFARRALVS